MDELSAKSLQLHSHLLTLNRSVKSIDQIEPKTALDVYHVLHNSTIRATSVRVFKIDTTDKLAEAESYDFNYSDKMRPISISVLFTLFYLLSIM